jgi:hypothetical protein
LESWERGCVGLFCVSTETGGWMQVKDPLSKGVGGVKAASD